MKRYTFIILVMLSILLGIGMIEFKSTYFSVNDIVENLKNFKDTKFSKTTHTNWHEIQNLASIEEANDYVEKRLEKHFDIYLNKVLVDTGYDWDGKLFIPIRSMGKSLNWSVNWIPEKQMIQLVKENEKAYVDIINLFGKAYIDIDTLERILNIDQVVINENSIYLWKNDPNISQVDRKKTKYFNFYIDNMKMTDAAIEYENHLYVPTKIFALSLGRTFHYDAEEGYVTIDDEKVDTIFIEGVSYVTLKDIGSIIDISSHSFEFDDSNIPLKEPNIIFKGHRKKQIALTFDDYIDNEVLPLLDILDDCNVKASFFIIGNTIEANKDILKEIHKRGHLIANHTWDHLNNHTITDDEFRAQLISTQLVIQKNIGIVPLYYRPPGGYYNERMADIARDIGLTTAMWSLNSNDANFDSKPAHIIDTVLSNITPGSIIVMHTKRQSTIEALPSIIKSAKEQGYEFVKIDAFDTKGGI
ncbi:polysaccharide deacetylase family protein [Clostridium formicaceticum]|uniref:Peptidoglycan-N-acetylglucosamine deacetylase n=1 Tax=Clostridium formicaceticum TaxID=1497 RepID=A0AAC9RL34_9CLOT|nr:polysaccharide deacetylase family protein [Clostridium formicaceticum]AOY76830.1 hypothetical protein BJL90_13795 [Clostridium formicaceticum]ARE87303.1 Peptidoglycan-N-acetylglucosamine deacetylase [Clostridium formicaceticum]